MAFINGKEVMFSAGINITAGGGGVVEYNASEEYNKGDIVKYNGLLYSPLKNGTSGILPTDTSAWEDLTVSKAGVADVERMYNYIFRVEKSLLKPYEDDSDHYEKPVPEKVAFMARLYAVGGMTTHHKSKNIYTSATAQGIYLSSEGSATATSLPAGTYFIKAFGDGVLDSITRNGVSIVSVPASDDIYTLPEKAQINFRGVAGGGYLKPMISRDLTVTEYEPYFKPYNEPNKVTAIESIGADGSTLARYEIPPEIQALDGYGKGVDSSRYNFINFDNKTFVKAIGEKTIIAGEVTLAKEYSNITYFAVPKPADDINNGANRAFGTNISGFDDKWHGTPFNDAKHLYCCLGNAGKTHYWIGFPVGTTLSEAQAELAGRTLEYTYKTAAKVETDVASYLSIMPYDCIDDLLYIDVESVGFIRCENEKKSAVPSNIYFSKTP